VGKIAEKAVCRSEFLTWHCIFSAKLTKTHSIRLFFFDDFAYWVSCRFKHSGHKRWLTVIEQI